MMLRSPLCIFVLTSCVTVSTGQSLVDIDSVSRTLAPVETLMLPEASPRPPRPDPGRVLEIPESVDPSGETDVSAMLQRVIDRAPDGSVIRFQPGATYRLDEALLLDGRADLVLDGERTMLRIEGCTVQDSAFVVGQRDPSSSITIRGFEIEGGNDRVGGSDAYLPGCEFQMGVAVYQSALVDIEDVEVRRVNGDCVYVGGDGSEASWSTTVTFRDSMCSGTGRMGVAVVGGTDILVEGVRFDDIGLFPFDVEPNGFGDGARDVFFVRNEVGAYTQSDQFNPYVLKTDGGGDEGAPVSRVVFAHNRVSGGPLRVSATDINRSQVIVAHNESTVSASGPVMLFENVDGLTVYGNDQPLDSGPLAFVRASDDVLIQ